MSPLSLISTTMQDLISENKNILTEVDIAKMVHTSLYNWIADKAITIQNIIDLINDVNCKEYLDNYGFQELIALSCLEGLAARYPVSCEEQQVIEDSLDELIWIIISYSDGVIISLLYEIWSFLSIKCITDWLQVNCSPKQCPNPCLRLELYRLLDGLKVQGTISQDILISTLVEISDKFSNLKNKGMVKISAFDLRDIMNSHSINMKYILDSDYPNDYKERIVIAFVKFTNLFAISLEKETRIQNEINTDVVLSCLEFCGLLTDSDSYKVNLFTTDKFAEIICKNSNLQEYVADILQLIKEPVSEIKKAKYDRNDKLHCVPVTMYEFLGILVSAEARLMPQRLQLLPQYLGAREQYGISKPIAQHLLYFTLLKNRYDSRVRFDIDFSIQYREIDNPFSEFAYLQEQSKYNNFSESNWSSSEYESSGSSEGESGETSEEELNESLEEEGGESSQEELYESLELESDESSEEESIERSVDEGRERSEDESMESRPFMSY